MTEPVQGRPDAPVLGDPTREERRRGHRLYEPFPVLLRGVDARGTAFEIDTLLDNLCSGGCYLRLARRLEVGMRLFAIVSFYSTPSLEQPAPRIAVRGVVRRVEPQPDGRWGVAVQFTRHRFL